MRVVRTLHLLVALVVPALLGIFTGMLVALLSRDRRRTLNAVATVVGWLAPRLAGLRIEVDAASQAHLQRPAVITFNHQSGLDPVILCALLQRDVVGVAKDSLRRNPLLGPLLRVTGSIFLGAREERRERVLAQASAVLAQGLSIVIAPEGTRVHNGAVGSFHTGACLLAQRCHVPLVPVVIFNSGERLAPRSRELFPGPVRVRVLAPRRISEDDDIEQATRALEQSYVDTLATR
jgi:putative phosphoserine phosphatase/1-acylglycerol-3-phosphate O-acyltransferase